MNKPVKKDGIRAFTLMEVIVASLVLSVVLAAMYKGYYAGYETWDVGREQAYLQGEARIALNQMGTELRNATRTDEDTTAARLDIPNTAPNNKSIIFCVPADNNADGYITGANGKIEWDTTNPITYQYNPNDRTIERVQAGVTTIIARDVSNVTFSDMSIDNALPQNEVKIVITLTKTTLRQRVITVAMTSVLAVRN